MKRPRCCWCRRCRSQPTEGVARGVGTVREHGGGRRRPRPSCLRGHMEDVGGALATRGAVVADQGRGAVAGERDRVAEVIVGGVRSVAEDRCWRRHRPRPSRFGSDVEDVGGTLRRALPRTSRTSCERRPRSPRASSGSSSSESRSRRPSGCALGIRRCFGSRGSSRTSRRSRRRRGAVPARARNGRPRRRRSRHRRAQGGALMRGATANGNLQRWTSPDACRTTRMRRSIGHGSSVRFLTW